MVRAYKSDFIRNLNLKSLDYEINPEIIYKGIILRARIIEIPSHLDWSFQNKYKKRTSAIHFARGILSGLMSAFILKPYFYFISTGLILFLIALYIIGWIIINTIRILPTIQIDQVYFDDRFSYAIGEVFLKHPHAFLVGGVILIISVTFLVSGLLSLQNKRYFEELFHQGTSIKKNI